jgi:phosphoenolpyruvate-protein phosphotransferase (PTS system enzyme I)
VSVVIEGVGASPGRALGTAWRFDWEVPLVRHRTIGPDAVDRELARFGKAREEALRRAAELEREATERIGPFEGKIFESQARMTEDPVLVAGTIAYIRENFLAAERAFELQMLEHRVRMMDSAHAMVLDRLADLHDVRARVLSRLLGLPDPDLDVGSGSGPVIVVAQDIAPSLTVRMDPDRVVGIVTAAGSRGSHSVLLARSLGIPVIVGVGAGLSEIGDGERLLLDGRTGRLVLRPSPAEEEGYLRSVAQAARRREMLAALALRPTRTVDGVQAVVQVNLDQPFEAADAVRLGAEGVGLFRSEFLVIARREFPGEEEQLTAYREVLEAFPGREVTLRTFDIGGDKFPSFLSVSPEDNPYLGWRAIRICLDLPELFGNQLRAAVRASGIGNLRLLLPFVVSVDEVRATRELLAAIYEELGMAESGRRLPVGVMVETPAAVETLDLLAPWVDFVSLGTNDLTQYVLAADRGNAKLAGVYDPLHPALVRQYARVERECARHGLDLSVCGELASEPAGLAVLLGLGYRKFSVSLSALPEIRELIRHLSVRELEKLCARHDRWESAAAVRSIVEAHLEASGALAVGGSAQPAEPA